VRLSNASVDQTPDDFSQHRDLNLRLTHLIHAGASQCPGGRAKAGCGAVFPLTPALSPLRYATWGEGAGASARGARGPELTRAG
jgi:hypothetical protein